MLKTKKKHTKHATTKKKKATSCPINLKPFVEQYIQKHGSRLSAMTVKQEKKQFLRELLSKFAPNSIKPEDNFYDYINYQWLKNITLEEQQKYIVQVDDFRLMQDKVYHQLDDIILTYVKENDNKLATNLKHFYQSVIDMNPIEDSKRLAKEAVETVDALLAEDNPWKMLAFFNRDEMLASGAPFVWSVDPDIKNPDVFQSNLIPHRFFLVDIAVYYDDGKDVSYKAKYRNEFKKYVKKVFETCLGKKHGYHPEDIFNVEVEIFDSLGCMDVTPNEQEYNKVTKEECKRKYGFDWEEFTKQLGYTTVPESFTTFSLNYLKCGTDLLLEKWKSREWRTFWVFLLLRRIVRITRKWETISFDFYGKFERGQEQINHSDAVSASLYMSIPFNTFLTNQYIAKYADPLKLEYVKTLCNDLLKVFQQILERNTWLSPQTKKYALYKLSKFRFIIGKPDKLREDPDLDYGTNLYENMQKINDWRHEKFIQLENKPVIDIPMMDWTQYPVKMTGTQAYIVNASYTPSRNTIYINQGYIQKPFVDLDERGIEYNLANIGYVLAHEMSHGFDDFGSKYDADGRLHNWWSPADAKYFKKLQADVTRQYEAFAKRDGIVFDASIGVGENLADISGLSICDAYLRYFQENNEDIIPIRNLSFQAFYTYYALQSKQYIGKKAISAQLKTNPHPLDKYRCNVPLSRSEIFRALFNVTKKDGMWWHNTNTIW